MKRIDEIKIRITKKESIEEVYDLVEKVFDNLIEVRSKKNDKYGFIDYEGNEVVPCIYDDTFLVGEEKIAVKKTVNMV